MYGLLASISNLQFNYRGEEHGGQRGQLPPPTFIIIP